MTVLPTLEIQPVSILLIVLSVILYTLDRKYNYWKYRGVPQVSGLLNDFLFQYKKSRSGAFIEDLYKKFASSHPYLGLYDASNPSLLVLDPSLIRQIMITDFAHFTDSFAGPNNDVGGTLRHAVTYSSGQKWRKVRSKVTQFFTASQLRSMLISVDACIRALDQLIQETLLKTAEIDVDDLVRRFSVDVMGACVFGIDFGNIRNGDSEHMRMTRKVSPKRTGMLWDRLFDKEADDYFTSLTKEAFRLCKERNEKRKDFLQLLIDLQLEERERLTDQDNLVDPVFTEEVITANAFEFLVAGHKGIAAGLAFCLHDIALHTDVMERVYEEIILVKTAHGGKIDYDAIKEMTYIGCVLAESARLHSAVSFLPRLCTKTYYLQNSSLTIDKGVTIKIPIAGLHQDERYFSKPEEYDPERFTDENKRKIIAGTYLPFGEGPRTCMAKRFAVMVQKAVLAHILGHYSIHPCAKTERYITLNPKTMMSSPLNGIYLEFRKRDG